MASRLTRTFAITRYVDLDNGNDANTGATAAQAWRTLGKVVTALFPGSSASGDTISVLVILAGTSGGTNATSTGTDQFTYDASVRAGRTEVAFRMWQASDGARPSSGTIGRPLLRADVPFTSLTQIGATATYKSNVLPVGTLLIGGSVLFKPATLSQLDVDGAWKCHMLVTGQGTDADATIAAALTANQAYYKTDTREVFVCTTGLTTTASHYGWTLDQATENFSKIRPIGFDYVGCEDIDTLYGERGIVVFDSAKPCQAELYTCRAYEHGVHSLMCSYTSSPLQNIVMDGCEAYGLGLSTTGNTMLAIMGGSGNYDLLNVRIINCRVRRYMLQNPSGARYSAAQYPIYHIGIGTAVGTSYGLTKDAVISGCMLEDVTSAKTSTVMATPITVIRCQTPVDRTAFNSYPVRMENCYINTLGTWLIYQAADCGDFAVSMKNCRVYMSSLDATLFSWGVRTGCVFYEPATAGTTQWLGIFSDTDWKIDVGLGDGANTFTGFGPHDNSGAGMGLRSYITARYSRIATVSKASGIVPIFEQNSTNSVANKNLFLDVQNCSLACITPVGSPITFTQLVGRDLPASGNTSRIFLNNKYFNIRQDNWSAANATYAGFVSNVDPYAQLADEDQYVKPDFAPDGKAIRRAALIIAP